MDKFKPKLNKTWIVLTHTHTKGNIYIYIYIYIYIQKSQDTHSHINAEKNNFKLNAKPLQHTHTTCEISIVYEG